MPQMTRSDRESLPATHQSPRLAPAGWIAAACLLAAACNKGGAGDATMTASGTTETVGRDIHWDASSAERFGVSSRDFSGAGMQGGGMPGGEAQSSALHWDTPAGWVELPTSAMREANFRVAGDERAECYLTTLTGTAGGLAANVNRWRAQVSLAQLSAEEIEALPRIDWLGGKAVVADFEGLWQGMSGDQAQAGWRLVGLLLVDPVQSRFLKMVGPSDLIASQLDAFHALAASFHAGHGDSPHAAGGSAGPSSGADMPGAMVSKPIPGATPTENHSASVAWNPPATWKRQGERTMRECTYTAGAQDEVECYVTVLGGDGGGLLANINRWCKQFGATELTDADLAGLTHVTIDGTDAVIVEMARGAGATAPANQEFLMGAVCVQPGRAVFVKMTGPRAAVEGERAAFVEFCGSLKAAR